MRDTIQLRDIPLPVAKLEIFEVLKENPGLDYYDISKILSLDIEDVIKACQKLIKEGAIGEA